MPIFMLLVNYAVLKVTLKKEKNKNNNKWGKTTYVPQKKTILAYIHTQ